MHTQGPEHHFFQRFTAQGRIDDLCILLVTHLLPDRPLFIEAVASLGRLGAILPKPKSIHAPSREWAASRYPVVDLDRHWSGDPALVVERLAPLVRAGERLVILDIGGYFARTQGALRDHFGERFLGVVEMTENGLQRYEAATLAVPVLSVARSPLKQAEDVQIGLSVVYSAESLARSLNRTLNACQVALFGYGKVGHSIAFELRRRNLWLDLVEIAPLRQLEALSHGFRLTDKTAALARAELVICSTGNRVLDCEDLLALRGGALVASVTSADDEFAFTLDGLGWPCEEICQKVMALTRPDGTLIYLLNGGEAVNFAHGAVIGEYAYLVLAEILEGARQLADTDREVALHGLSPQATGAIARHWLADFHHIGESIA